MTTGRLVQVLCLLFVLVLAIGGRAAAAEETWTDLRPDIFGDQEILDGSEWLTLDAPYRAHDAAIVPIEIAALRPQGDVYIQNITLVIDENPAPVAAVFHMGPQSGLASLSTRVRVNAYSNVRAIAETSDGNLYMVSRYVKASGGCSAPAGKDAEEAMASLGKMRLRQYTPVPGSEDSQGPDGLQEVQLMIRHPNHSGFQMDQTTHYYIPAHFVSDIEIRQGDDLLLSVEGAISLSEDPSLRFHFLPNGAGSLTARITDTEEQSFTKTWTVESEPAPDS